MTALVTGAGGAIDRAIAIRLFADGHRVAGVDIDIDAASATADLIREQGGTALAIRCDLRHEDEIVAAFGTVKASWGRSTYSSTTPPSSHLAHSSR